ncbi:MAG: MATE family efflux transporter [Pseudoalteromonas sp.]|uniref:MATE family efflux transporter n=1 Tax=unclassified Pseudoalteromonas TaxID=194690 RepID=UPI003F9D1A5B
MALPPIVGNLKGRVELKQIMNVVKLACGFVIGVQILLSVIIYALANPLAHALGENNAIVLNLIDYFAFVPLSYAALGMCMITVSVCNALGFPTTALFISILRLFLCYLPLLWLGSYFYGLTGLFIGMACGNTLVGFVDWQLFKQQYNRLTMQFSGHSIVV